MRKKLEKLLALEDAARDCGGDEVRLLLAKQIVMDERVRMKCRLNTCRHYGQNLMCPPFVPSVEEFRRVLARYTFALLVQLTRPSANDRAEMEGVFHRQAMKLNEIMTSLEQRAFGLGFPLALALGGGECKLCAECAAVRGEQVCAQPERARPSMEAVGIDVLATAGNAGLSAGFVPGEIRVTGLLLID